MDLKLTANYIKAVRISARLLFWRKISSNFRTNDPPMKLKLEQKDIIIKIVKAYLMYTFAVVGISTLIGLFLFKEEQTKGEIISHLILGMIMSFAFLILDDVKRGRKVSHEQTEFD